MTVGIVTGAARGMGAACAERVADMVDVLVLVDRNEAVLATQADLLAAAGHRAPSSRATRSFSSVETTAIQRAPRCFRTSISAVPTPPAAPCTSAVSPV